MASSLVSTYGQLNGHAVGIILKELVRRAIVAIRAQRLIHESRPKDTPGRDFDLVTSADLAAQAIYLRSIRECFPGLGIIGEENGLNIPCTRDGLQHYLVFDPLDGTKAFARRQSSGIATQVALVRANPSLTGSTQPSQLRDIEVIAAFVGDVISQEIYGFRPGSDKVHRITDLVASERLSALDRSKPLSELPALARRHPLKFEQPILQRLLAPRSQGGLAKDLLIDNGSASIAAAKLWKGEVGFMVAEPFLDTPWDTLPVVGIYRRLDFVSLYVNIAGTRLIPTEYSLSLSVTDRRQPLVWVHRNHLPEILQWTQRVS